MPSGEHAPRDGVRERLLPLDGSESRLRDRCWRFRCGAATDVASDIASGATSGTKGLVGVHAAGCGGVRLGGGRREKRDDCCSIVPMWRQNKRETHRQTDRQADRQEMR